MLNWRKSNMSTPAFPYVMQGDNITVFVNGTPHDVNKSHLNYNELVAAIKAGDWDTVKDVIDPKKALLKYGKGRVAILGETLFYDDVELNSMLARQIISMYKDGFDIEPFVKFIENLMKNPSKRAVEELYGFLDKGKLPITPEGNFLAYKKVRDDYTDVHSGTFDNSVGQICQMPRNQVDEDKNRTCSAGLHFCSMSYLQSFGGSRIMIVSINPKDVVSIPADYNDSKGRTCKYKVVGELGVNPEDAFTASVQTGANDIPTPDSLEW
jgi:hypothetical protein